jgi:ABC-type multidrug transport system ATPase subunit
LCTRRFWGCSARPLRIEDEEAVSEDEVVAEEKAKVVLAERSAVASTGLRVVGLSKVFRTNICGFSSTKDIHAVNSIFLEGMPDELICLLGHNGAGKSTLIGMLTGIISPSEGYAKICGFDISDNIDEARKVLGVCPQHDILWDELTAREHLSLYGRLKGLLGEELKSGVDLKLAEVKLSEVGDYAVGTYSGGMKRRLSVAIAGIGNPKVIIMDEPTTGMDPINRREVWKLIQKLKKGRVVILTTHSMEEADVLSDRIAVIVDGSVKCIGSPLYLKNNFGDGYRVSIISNDSAHLAHKLRSLMPSCKIIDESAGSLMVAVTKVEELRRFVSMMEGDSPGIHSRELRASIQDWGLSNTTLEEVFMRVTGKKHHDDARSEESYEMLLSPTRVQ